MIRPARWYLVLMAALSVRSSPANAAQLSMRFTGGAAEVTLAVGATAVIEVVWTMAPQVKTARNLAALNNRFDLTGTANIQVSATSSPLSGWNTSGSDAVGGPLSDFFASADGSGNPIVETTSTFESVVQSIQVVNVDGASGTVQIAFRAGDPLPDAITSTGGQWVLVGSAPGSQQFDIGQGSPGYTDINGVSNPAAPLVIHFAGGGSGGGGGGDPVDNTNDNQTPPPANDNTPDGGTANDNEVVVDPNNDNADVPENDNAVPPDDSENANDNTSTNGGNDNDEPPPDNVADNENASNDNRPRPGGGVGVGSSGGACGLGMLGAGGWMLATIVFLRFGWRHS